MNHFDSRSKNAPRDMDEGPPSSVVATQRAFRTGWRRQDSNLGRPSRQIYSANSPDQARRPSWRPPPHRYPCQTRHDSQGAPTDSSSAMGGSPHPRPRGERAGKWNRVRAELTPARAGNRRPSRRTARAQRLTPARAGVSRSCQSTAAPAPERERAPSRASSSSSARVTAEPASTYSVDAYSCRIDATHHEIITRAELPDRPHVQPEAATPPGSTTRPTSWRPSRPSLSVLAMVTPPYVS
jgi:hypothetical protein